MASVMRCQGNCEAVDGPCTKATNDANSRGQRVREDMLFLLLFKYGVLSGTIIRKTPFLLFNTTAEMNNLFSHCDIQTTSTKNVQKEAILIVLMSCHIIL